MWTVKYENETYYIDGNEYFNEWWAVTDGQTTFKADSEKDAVLICNFLNNHFFNTNLKQLQ